MFDPVFKFTEAFFDGLYEGKILLKHLKKKYWDHAYTKHSRLMHCYIKIEFKAQQVSIIGPDGVTVFAVLDNKDFLTTTNDELTVYLENYQQINIS